MAEQNTIYEGVKGYSPKYSNFDLSHEHKFTCNFGELIPTMLIPVIPGDVFSMRSEVLVRFAPMLAPILHRVNVFTHYFFVPNRLVWEDWEDFITGGDDGTASPTFPKLTGSGGGTFGKGTVLDYFGIPVNNNVPATAYNFISELPFRAYHLIWSEYYRDQVLQTEFDPNSGPSDSVLMGIRLRAWEKDYFTSALSTPQKGSAATTAVSGSIAVTYLTQGLATGTPSTGSVDKAAANALQVGGNPVTIENISTLTPSLTVSINDLRLASRLQEFWERRMRGGSRYTEYVKSEFNVSIPDMRAQRPEYLGGGYAPVNISTTYQTSEDGTTELGKMAGQGTAYSDENKGSYRATEHGYIMAIVSVMPRTAYQEGVPKHFLYDDKFDWPLPAFAHLGEQVVENREIYFDSTTSGDDPTGTFGYQQRYAEAKQIPTQISGDFRDTLDHWHIARQFGAEPSLNEDFIQCDPADEDINRIFASEEAATDKLWIQCYHDVKAQRPLPFFADPRL
jgi:hypothetical protein